MLKLIRVFEFLASGPPEGFLAIFRGRLSFVRLSFFGDLSLPHVSKSLWTQMSCVRVLVTRTHVYGIRIQYRVDMHEEEAAVAS